MPDPLIQSLLNGSYKHPETDVGVRVPIKRMAVGHDLAKAAKDHVNECAGRKIESICLVADKNTYDAMGQAVVKALGGHNMKTVVFADEVVPDQATADHIMQRAASAEFLIAVGSGTINDLVKYAAYLEAKPYIVYGTAPSMNGYTSANASIVVDGHKKTLPARLATGVFLDTDVCSAAPKRLIASGIGDVLCRSTAQADWLMSHLMLGTAYDSLPFELIKKYEEELLKHPDNIKNLCYALLVSGIGMYLAGGSYPASQGEHLIAHTMEMVFGDRLPKTYHGEEIAVTTLTMARLQEERLKQKAPTISDVVHTETIEAFFGKEIGAQCLLEMQKKSAVIKAANLTPEVLDARWKLVQDRLGTIRVPVDTLEKTLKAAGAPTTPSALGWPDDLYENAVKHAHLMRNRFTFLDL